MRLEGFGCAIAVIVSHGSGVPTAMVVAPVNAATGVTLAAGGGGGGGGGCGAGELPPPPPPQAANAEARMIDVTDRARIIVFMRNTLSRASGVVLEKSLPPSQAAKQRAKL